MTNLTPPPDIEAWVYSNLKSLGGITVFAYDSAPGQHYINEDTGLQVDCRASSKARARDRAYDARSRLLALVGAPWDAGIVQGVTVDTGPSWLPDEDGAPRYTLRVMVKYRSARSTTQP